MPSPSRFALRPLVTLGAIASTFAVNAWSNIQPINGASIGEISNTEFAAVLITPANYAFIIWGVIYLGLIGFGIYQLLPRQRDRSDLNPVRQALILSSLAQILWVFLFLFRWFWGSLVAMLVILAALAYGYVQRRALSPTSPNSWRDRWWVDRSLSLYFGWISVATIVNWAIAFYSNGWTTLGLGMPTWTVLLISIATALGGYMALTYGDAVYAGVFVWALVAIAVRQAEYPLIVSAAGAGSLVLLAAMGRSLWRSARP